MSIEEFNPFNFIYDSSLPYIEKSVLIFLWNEINIHNHSSRTIQKTHEEIAKKLSLSSSRIRTAIRNLEIWEVLIVYPQFTEDGGRAANLYKINFLTE